LSENRVNLLTLSHAFSAFFGAGSGREFPTSFGSGSCETTNAAQSGLGTLVLGIERLGNCNPTAKERVNCNLFNLV